MTYDVAEPWCDVSSIELKRCVREHPRPLEARPPLTPTKVNYPEWLDLTFGARPAKGVAKSWKHGRCTGCQIRGDTDAARHALTECGTPHSVARKIDGALLIEIVFELGFVGT